MVGTEKNNSARAKARSCLTLNVGAPFVPQGKKAPTLQIAAFLWLDDVDGDHGDVVMLRRGGRLPVVDRGEDLI